MTSFDEGQYTDEESYWGDHPDNPKNKKRGAVIKTVLQWKSDYGTREEMLKKINRLLDKDTPTELVMVMLRDKERIKILIELLETNE